MRPRFGLIGELKRRFTSQEFRRASLVAGLLTVSIWVFLTLTDIIYGRNYSPFILRFDGLDETRLSSMSVEYRSAFGSEGTLLFDKEFRLFRTENWAQPIASIKLRCPMDVDLGDTRATLWYMNLNSVYGGIPLDGGGQVISGLGKYVDQTFEGDQLVKLGFRPLSSLSISRFGKAMNWKGDLTLVFANFLRSGLISLGLVLCGFSIWVFLRSAEVKGLEAESVTLTGDRGVVFRDVAAWCILIVVLAAVIYGRDSIVFLSPAMELEDGTLIFAHFYEHREISEIFRSKFGYVPLIPNIIGYLSVRIPRQLASFWMCFVPAALAILFYTFPFLRCYSRFFPCRTSAWVTSLVFCLAPLSSQLMYSNTDYMIWNLLGILFLLSLVDPAVSKASSASFAVVLSLLVCSHPLSILLVVVLGLRLLFEGRLQWYWVFGSGVALLYQSFGVEHDSVVRDLGLFGQLERFLQVAKDSALICVRLGIRSLVGPVTFQQYLSGQVQGLLGIGAVLIAVAAACSLFIRVPAQRGAVFLACCIIYFCTFLGIWSRGIGWVSDFDDRWRYTYIQSFVALGLTTCLLFWIADYGQRFLSRRHFLVLNAPKILLSLMLIAWFWGHNRQRGYLCRSAVNDGSYSYASPGNGVIMRDFLNKLLTQEAAPGFNGEVFLEAEKVSDWKVVIDTRRKVGVQTP